MIIEVEKPPLTWAISACVSMRAPVRARTLLFGSVIKFHLSENIEPLQIARAGEIIVRMSRCNVSKSRSKYSRNVILELVDFRR
jgi:low temperature requirement protein LtrA